MSKPYPIVGRAINMFGNWLARRRDIREVRELDRGDFTRIAQELSVAPTDLDTFVQQGSHAADELPKLLTVLGLDEQLLSQTQPYVRRDMERVCSSCQKKRQCDRDLSAGTSAQHYEEYCLNAPTIDALNRQADPQGNR